ncbi:hypothetical protein [Nonomuraea sp. NPDC005650]|uniref:hypothetical protein n=1 Tax=Nonomuraea sp. NPDC005650 TaxID=3157045 RepID=UPI0033AB2643
MAARNAPNPWTAVRRRDETGRAVLETIETNGGLAGLVAEHEALAAFHGDNYLPLLDRFYRSHRALLLRLAGVLGLEPASADRRLLQALEFVRANATRASWCAGISRSACSPAWPMSWCAVMWRRPGPKPTPTGNRSC